MACVRCGRPEEVSVTHWRVTESLCLRCAEQLVAVSGFQVLVKSFRRDRAPAQECPYCGMTRGELVKTAIAGCPLCYEVFRDDIETLI